MTKNIYFNKKQFVIFSLHRTGSSLLVDILDRIPGIKCYYELYKPDTDYTEKEWLTTYQHEYLNWKERNKTEPLKYWNELIHLNCNSRAKAIGFKIFWDQNQILLKHVADSDDYEKIVLLRNPIARYISSARAKATGKWFQVKSETSTKKLTFNPQEFEFFLRDHICGARYYLRKAKEMPHKYIVTTYENVVNKKIIKDILSKLEIDCPIPSELTTQYVKQTIEPIKSCFLNYEQMKEYLISNHASLLSEPGSPTFD